MAFQNASIWGYLWALIYALVVDWLLVGVIVASTCCYLANKYLRQYHSHSVEQEVEWMYAFDVHTNGYICGFVLTHLLQVCMIISIIILLSLSSLTLNSVFPASIFIKFRNSLMSHLQYLV